MKIDGFWNAAGEILCVTGDKCMLCGKDIFDDKTGFCEKCKENVTFNGGNVCRRCGIRIGGEQEYCSECSMEKMYFDRAYSAFVYEKGFLDIIYAVKFGGQGALCKTLAYYLAFLVHRYHLTFDAVTFVPMTEKSQKRRGYNQAQLLASYFCDIIGFKPLLDCLRKRKETERQEALGKADRKTNVENAYEVTDQEAVKGKEVLLIDDVKTTGATLNNCAKALKKAGAEKVTCLTLAGRDEWFLTEEATNNETKRVKYERRLRQKQCPRSEKTRQDRRQSGKFSG